MQVSLRIPGIPRSGAPFDDLIRAGAAEAVRALAGIAMIRERLEVDDPMLGLAVLLRVDVHVSEQKAKRSLVNVEDSSSLASLWDLDLFVEGEPLSRRALDLPPRSCFVCTAPAKRCAVLGTHPHVEARAAAERIIARSFGDGTGRDPH